jgi:glycosyltransferase involved in cell wall biosynthesis
MKVESAVIYPRISIVIPVLNQAQFLQDAIQSILLQKYPNIELIVIDGGSSDSCLEIIKNNEASISYWVSEADRGQSHAINKGFARCTGEITTFLSSDDYYLPGVFFDVADRYLQKIQVGAIIGGFSFLDTDRAQPDEPVKPFLDGALPVDLMLGPPGKYRLHQVSTFYTRLALDAVGRQCRERQKQYGFYQDATNKWAGSLSLQDITEIEGLLHREMESVGYKLFRPVQSNFLLSEKLWTRKTFFRVLNLGL